MQKLLFCLMLCLAFSLKANKGNIIDQCMYSLKKAKNDPYDYEHIERSINLFCTIISDKTMHKKASPLFEYLLDNNKVKIISHIHTESIRLCPTFYTDFTNSHINLMVK